ncbi:unnamed protein product [Diatraea saccharalis]|uniref:Uncharacterized protein n=1 Tax=Diatraea saccharalis TaxID=40085 RepID=A0A9N9QZS8_9NEOP|nr:unnamed protein product [Diatraea saccharalis]
MNFSILTRVWVLWYLRCLRYSIIRGL